MVASYVVRVWLPDRPGALGAVASRVGAVRGDVVGIEILERGAGRAVDELVVELPAGMPVDLLLAEISQVDGVDVEDIRPVADALHDPRVDAFELVATLVACPTADAVVAGLCQSAARIIGADWAAVIELAEAVVIEAVGRVPPPAWLAAYVSGSQAAAPTGDPAVAADDVAWSPLPGSDLALLLGRDGHAFRARERRSVAALARIVDIRHQQLRPVATAT